MQRISSPAKINLFLEVTGKRPDGFHDIESVFLEVDLADRLAIEPAENDVSLICEYPGLTVGSDNLVIRAAEILKRIAGVRGGARFHLEKNIPLGSGLGGGSSNAAAALKLANDFWDTGLSDIELAAIGAMVGSDVPFFLYGGTCLCRGRGEMVEALPDFPEGITLGLALSGVHSDTAAAYRGLSLPRLGEARHAALFMEALALEDVESMACLAFNRFEPTVFAAYPKLADAHVRLTGAGLPTRLCGSGSALWFFGSTETANEALAGTGITVLDVRAFGKKTAPNAELR